VAGARGGGGGVGEGGGGGGGEGGGGGGDKKRLGMRDEEGKSGTECFGTFARGYYHTVVRGKRGVNGNSGGDIGASAFGVVISRNLAREHGGIS